jgi:transcriptional regulator with XRE-family HTH domain|tara:strand:+ start:63 stop:347 length:285 start_codon:yes stop_codon:yes gene_type:complete
MSSKTKCVEEVNFNRTVGGNIKFLRNLSKLNQSKVGIVLDTTFQQIQKYEKGVNGLSSRKLKLLANKFNVSMDHIADPMMIAKYKEFNDEHNES